MQYLLGRPFDIIPTKKMASSIVFLTAKESGKVISVVGAENLGGQKNIVKHNISVKMGDTVRAAKENANRLGYVISVAKTPEEAKQSALQAVDSVKLNIQVGL